MTPLYLYVNIRCPVVIYSKEPLQWMLLCHQQTVLVSWMEVLTWYEHLQKPCSVVTKMWGNVLEEGEYSTNFSEAPPQGPFHISSIYKCSNPFHLPTVTPPLTPTCPQSGQFLLSPRWLLWRGLIVVCIKK